MRLWSLNPAYLDSKGLVALWREGLLAQKVLMGNTKGYRDHPQLQRFKNSANPIGAIATYLRAVVDEADRRGYRFDRSKIVKRRIQGTLPVTKGQLDYELSHLLNKLQTRNPPLFEKYRNTRSIKLHPLFTRVPGKVENWEVVNG